MGACTCLDSGHHCNYRLHSNQHHRLGSTITKTVDTGLASLPALSFLHTRSSQGGENISTMQIPFWERYTLTIQEASQYFRIGENKLRKIVSENKDADFVLWNGTRPQIKRTKFERFVDRLNLI